MHLLLSALFSIAWAAPVWTHEKALHTFGPEPAQPGGGPSARYVFSEVDQLGHQDDFWSNAVVGDADHDGLQEVAYHWVPVTGPTTPRVVFYEDDGTGQFDLVHSFDFDDGGVLAMGDVDEDGLTDLFLERALGVCRHEFVRVEASAPNGFPDHVDWTAPKEGNVVDFAATIADVDGDGRKELVTTDSTFDCLPTTLKIFEVQPDGSLQLTYSRPFDGWLGNPVVADFDLDGLNEILFADAATARLQHLEAVADDTYALLPTTAHDQYNAYQLALVHVPSALTGTRPFAFLAGQRGDVDYHAYGYTSPRNDAIARVSDEPIPALCGASIPQITSADILGTPVREVVLDRLCDPVPVYGVDARGGLTLIDAPSVTESLEVIATSQTPVHSGAIVVGSYPNPSNPDGNSLVLEGP